ncbi:hypothetical protein BGZ95_002478 [Linnemannia exigua]|uniref:Uncharacterized protein n=1 Tax=Linnemannia exigua TaxID=604196 RepID=A0AAD4H4A2_9FUNG|nr:hypothetical protein BGZ95_002478 [Linnemannia exigua]
MVQSAAQFASSNYDCKGHDILIIYEAWSEARWTAMENKSRSTLPSSSTNLNCTIKYTIRAVLQRRFPSLSNPFMSTPASKISCDWSATSTASIASKKTTMTPMPSAPYGRNQLQFFLHL